MNGKQNFAIDFIHVFTELRTRSADTQPNDHGNLATHGAVGLFLILWDFTPKEVDEANNEFWNRVSKNTLSSIYDAVMRLSKALESHIEEKRKLMIQMHAIAIFDNNISNDEREFIIELGQILDFRRSEMEDFFKKGVDLSLALHFYGEKYIEEYTN